MGSRLLHLCRVWAGSPRQIRFLWVLPANQGWGPSGHSPEEMAAGHATPASLWRFASPPVLSSSHLEVTYMHTCGISSQRSFSNAASFCDLMLGYNCLLREKNKILFKKIVCFTSALFQNETDFFWSFCLGSSLKLLSTMFHMCGSAHNRKNNAFYSNQVFHLSWIYFSQTV